jgi:hypothetical protein
MSGMLADSIAFGASTCNGLSYGNKITRVAYLQHQYNGDVDAKGNPNANAYSMGSGQYGCQLHQRGALAHADVDGMIVYRGKSVDILRCPYADYIGQIDEMMQAFGKARGLLVSDPSALGDAQIADLLVIGYGGSAPTDPAVKASWLASWGGVAHGLVVTDVRGALIESSDGGQIDADNAGKGTAIKQCERSLVKRANGWWLEDARGARRINYRIRGGELPTRAKP